MAPNDAYRHNLILGLGAELDRCDAEPKPPTERGWVDHGLPLEPKHGPHPIGVNTRTGQYVFHFGDGSEIVEAFWDENGAPDVTREVDATFENEVRPR